MMRISIFDLENWGRLIHEVDLYTSKYGKGNHIEGNAFHLNTVLNLLLIHNK